MGKKITQRVIQGLETRQRIFEVALELFTRNGYEATTVEDICLEVGVTRGAFYNHFDSKEHIIIEYYMEIDKQYKELAPQLSIIDDPIQRLMVFTHCATEVTMKLGPELMSVVYSYQISPARKTSPLIISRKRSLYTLLDKILREAIDAGVLRKDIETKNMCDTIIRAQRGIIMEWCISRGRIDLPARMEELVDVFYKGLAAESLPLSH